MNMPDKITIRKRKLVRDKIPELITEEWEAKNPVFLQIEDLPLEEQKKLWMEKLQEELDELKEAYESGDEYKTLEEALDLSMFLDEFKMTLDGWPNTYNRIAKDKYRRNGGTESHTVMEWDAELEPPEGML